MLYYDARPTKYVDATINRKILLFYQLIVNKTLSFMMIGNQRLQRQFDGLLMMGIIMPETC